MAFLERFEGRRFNADKHFRETGLYHERAEFRVVGEVHGSLGEESDFAVRALTPLDYCEEQPLGALAVAESTLGAILYGHPAVSISLMEDKKWSVNECLKRGFYREIIVLEVFKINPETLIEEHLDSKKALSKAFKKEAIDEMYLQPNIFCRLSRVTGIDTAEATPPSDFKEQKPPFKSDDDYIRYLFGFYP